jgi:hypothetical protein
MMRTTKRSLLLHPAATALGLAGYFAMKPLPGATLEDFGCLEYGMRRRRVEAILGAPPGEAHRVTWRDHSAAPDLRFWTMRITGSPGDAMFTIGDVVRAIATQQRVRVKRVREDRITCSWYEPGNGWRQKVYRPRELGPIGNTTGRPPAADGRG